MAADDAGVVGSCARARVPQRPRSGSVAVLPGIVCGGSAMPEWYSARSAHT